MKLRVGYIESIAFGLEYYCIQEKKWWGWSTIHRSDNKQYVKELAKHYESKGHCILWHI